MVKQHQNFQLVSLLGSTYRISGFMCIPTSNFQQTPDTETTLRFGKYTKFENISSDEFPRHDFNFVSYNQLEYKMHRKDTPTPQKQLTLTDYMGCLTRINNVWIPGSANTNQTVMRKLDIENLKKTHTIKWRSLLSSQSVLVKFLNTEVYNYLQHPQHTTVSIQISQIFKQSEISTISRQLSRMDHLQFNSLSLPQTPTFSPAVTVFQFHYNPLCEKATQTCISDLKPGSKNKILEPRVYRKWINRNPPRPTATDYCFILIDREGNGIQANMGSQDIPYFSSLLQEGCGCYV